MFLNYIGKPSLYLPGCMIVWGIISALTGITTKWVAHATSGEMSQLEFRALQFYWCFAHAIFPRFRGSGMFSWCPLPNLKMVGWFATVIEVD